jgi:hypothetical protein
VAFASRLLIDDFAFPNVSYISYLTPASSYVAYTSFVSAFPFNTKYPTRFMKSVRDVENCKKKILLTRELILLFVYLLRKGIALAGLCWDWTGGDLIEIEIRYHDAHAARILAAMRGCESGLMVWLANHVEKESPLFLGGLERVLVRMG